MLIGRKSKYKKIQEAREKDVQKGRRAVALYLLAQGVPVSKIVFATGLTLIEIEKLRLEK